MPTKPQERDFKELQARRRQVTRILPMEKHTRLVARSNHAAIVALAPNGDPAQSAGHEREMAGAFNDVADSPPLAR